MGNYGSSAMRLYEKVRDMGRKRYLAERDAPLTDESRRKQLVNLEPRVRAVMAQQDAQGRWIIDGKISSATFSKNVGILADYIALSR
jgi:hypothetical protein